MGQPVNLKEISIQTQNSNKSAPARDFRKQKKDMSAKCKVYIDNMLEARNKIVENVFNYSNDNGIRMPVAFQNIIVNIQGQLNLNVNSLVDITPLEAFDLIEEYLNKLKRSNFIQPNKLFEIMYLFYLNPRDLILLDNIYIGVDALIVVVS